MLNVRAGILSNDCKRLILGKITIMFFGLGLWQDLDLSGLQYQGITEIITVKTTEKEPKLKLRRN